MSETVELSHEALETIGHYVRRNLGAWIAEVVPRSLVDRDLELRERTIRVEEELKTQRELMRQGFEHTEKLLQQIDKRFEQIDKRFEQIDKRFEQIDKRFDDLHRNSTRWFTAITIMLGIIGLAVSISGFVR
ncbi:MAG: hypothetical protein EA384_14355 [Spirochaetaceae bacterium]|nr:MAG: hypothetical protein EA384_14355 [Spirochaetaceae bacterium]